jgi:polysaccharide pyruvyl transferase WcaK-like protein
MAMPGMTSLPRSRSDALARTGPAPDVPDRQFALAPRPDEQVRLRIGLFGLFGSGNSGNDGSLEAMLLFLRRVEPEAELVCFCASSEGATARITRDYGVPTIPLALARPTSALPRVVDRLSLKVPRQLASLVRAFRHARRLDVLIIPGTGILDDFQAGPLGMPLALFGWCLAARLGGTRIAFVSIGAGPIQHPVSRWLMRSAVAMAQYRSYRDTVSKAFMESIGFDTRDDAVYPDLAFKLPSPPPIRRQEPEGRRLTVGLGVMNYHGWRDDSTRGGGLYEAYVQKITTFALWLLDQGYHIRVLMGDVDDRRAVADVVSRLANARPDLPQDRLIADPMRSLHDLMGQIAETDVVAATRFHNVVCALKLCKPTISIGYAGKFDDLMAEMGLGCFCQHVERLDLDLLIKQFKRLLAGRSSYEHGLWGTNVLYQKRLGRQDQLLAARILHGAAPYRSGHSPRPKGAAT